MCLSPKPGIIFVIVNYISRLLVSWLLIALAFLGPIDIHCCLPWSHWHSLLQPRFSAPGFTCGLPWLGWTDSEGGFLHILHIFAFVLETSDFGFISIDNRLSLTASNWHSQTTAPNATRFWRNINHAHRNWIPSQRLRWSKETHKKDKIQGNCHCISAWQKLDCLVG